MKYKTIEELLDMITDRSMKTKLFDVYTKFRSQMTYAKGSSYNHQAWQGGFLDHTVDTMNIARLLYGAMNDKRKLSFTLSDALVIMFLHDIEKISEERIVDKMVEGNQRPRAKALVRRDILDTEGISTLLTPEQHRTIENIEIEVDYSNTRRGMIPLAAFCHMCDTASARIWFDNPLVERESWGWRESGSVGEEQLWGV